MPEVKPLVTAVVTTYNRFELAKRAIKSVLSQSLQPIQIIVVEDGSESGIEHWLASLSDCQQVEYFRQTENKGLAAARNLALSKARAEYIAYLDDDDVWHEVKLEKQFQLASTSSLEKPIVQCRLQTISSIANKKRTLVPKTTGKLTDSISKLGPATLSSVPMFKVSTLLEVGGYDESLPSSIDHDIWMKLSQTEAFAVNLDEVLVTTYVDRTDTTMMSCSNTRVMGVRQFVKKWRGTFIELMGEKRASQFLAQYEIRVLIAYSRRLFTKGSYWSASTTVLGIYCKFWKQSLFITKWTVLNFGSLIRRRMAKTPLG